MGKKQKKSGKQAGIAHKEAFQRMNYLYQASHMGHKTVWIDVGKDRQMLRLVMVVRSPWTSIIMYIVSE